jgi:thymidylate synthase
MKNYLSLLNSIVYDGDTHEDRTGVGRRSLFSAELRYNLADGFPLVTTRKIPIRPFIGEILWHLTGSKDIRFLNENKIKIWDEWAVNKNHIKDFIENVILKKLITKEEPESESLSQMMNIQAMPFYEHFGNSIGPIYGPNWRAAPGSEYNPFRKVTPHEDIEKKRLLNLRAEYINYLNFIKNDKNNASPLTEEEFIEQNVQSNIDQVQNLLNGLKKRPWSSRHVISSWVPECIPDEELPPQYNVILGKGALAPCPMTQQYFVTPPKTPKDLPRLSLKVTSRSCDFVLGGPTNIAEYSLLVSMIAQIVNMEPYEFIFSMGDVHIYTNQIETAKKQLDRDPKPLPKLVLNKNIIDLFDFTFGDISIDDYKYHPVLKYPISV